MLCLLTQAGHVVTSIEKWCTHRERCCADDACPLRQMHDNIPRYGLVWLSLAQRPPRRHRKKGPCSSSGWTRIMDLMCRTHAGKLLASALLRPCNFAKQSGLYS